MRGDESGTAEAALASARDLARRYAAEVRARLGESLRSIRIFGSAARGDWGESSDIDVLVLVDSLAFADTAWLARRAFELGALERGLVLQPVIMTQEDFDDMARLERRFALDVEREGVSL